MFKFFTIVLILLSALHVYASEIKPILNNQAFEGFKIGDKKTISDIKLTGYEYAAKNSEQIIFDDCTQAVMYGESKVQEYEIFRLRLLTTTCQALDKYLSANSSNMTFFPEKFEVSLIDHFPAKTMPLLYRAQGRHRGDKTIKQYYSSFKANIEKNGSIKFLSEEDEIYYTLMARGDFTNDGVEDLLVKSEWFARKARGKHVDLLILTRAGKNQPINIHWRLMKF